MGQVAQVAQAASSSISGFIVMADQRIQPSTLLKKSVCRSENPLSILSLRRNRADWSTQQAPITWCCWGRYRTPLEKPHGEGDNRPDIVQALSLTAHSHLPFHQEAHHLPFQQPSNLHSRTAEDCPLYRFQSTGFVSIKCARCLTPQIKHPVTSALYVRISVRQSRRDKTRCLQLKQRAESCPFYMDCIMQQKLICFLGFGEITRRAILAKIQIPLT